MNPVPPEKHLYHNFASAGTFRRNVRVYRWGYLMGARVRETRSSVVNKFTVLRFPACGRQAGKPDSPFYGSYYMIHGSRFIFLIFIFNSSKVIHFEAKHKDTGMPWTDSCLLPGR
jgi:hypothetical protein